MSFHAPVLTLANEKVWQAVAHSERDAGSRPAGPVLTRRVAHGEKDGAPEFTPRKPLAHALSARPSHNLNGVVGSRPAGPLLTRGIAQRRERWRARGSYCCPSPSSSELSPSSSSSGASLTSGSR